MRLRVQLSLKDLNKMKTFNLHKMTIYCYCNKYLVRLTLANLEKFNLSPIFKFKLVIWINIKIKILSNLLLLF